LAAKEILESALVAIMVEENARTALRRQAAERLILDSPPMRCLTVKLLLVLEEAAIRTAV
jgi:hypothetical protein